MWSTALQGIMDGVTRRSSHYKRGTLLVHSEQLLIQEGISAQPIYASPEAQYAILEDFYHRHAEHCEGVILDNIWEDAVVERLRDRLKRVVIVNRTTTLDFASSVHADFRLCAALAISHLLSRGFEDLFFVFSYEDCYVRQLREAVVETSQQVGAPLRKENFIYAPDAGAQQSLIERILGSRKRIGIYTPEDNWARLLLAELANRGVACPDKVGVLSGTGTRAAEEARMSSLQIDFERIGSLAVDLLRRDEPTSLSVSVELTARQTT
jgi:DNA-binding LacI/PurR family transcriptional regulator